MGIEGICKVYSVVGMEYRYGEFYTDRDYLVFEQNYALGMRKRYTYPISELKNIAIIHGAKQTLLTFNCDNLQFEITNNDQKLQKFADELRLIRFGTTSQDINQKDAIYTTHHHYVFAK